MTTTLTNTAANTRAMRGEVKRFGGVVDKFIGDAVVGVWDVPQAHEDDAERAIRAALAILDAVDADVRIAVNTGEVLATLDPTWDAGVGVVGDVVNTASRLQAVAPVGEILAGEMTVRLTAAAVDCEQLDAVTVKGKPEPIAVWRVIGARRAGGTRGVGSEAPFFGRSRELRLLRDV